MKSEISHEMMYKMNESVRYLLVLDDMNPRTRKLRKGNLREIRRLQRDEDFVREKNTFSSCKPAGGLCAGKILFRVYLWFKINLWLLLFFPFSSLPFLNNPVLRQLGENKGEVCSECGGGRAQSRMFSFSGVRRVYYGGRMVWQEVSDPSQGE